MKPKRGLLSCTFRMQQTIQVKAFDCSKNVLADMASYVHPVEALLLLISATGYYTLFYLSKQNTFLSRLQDAFKKGFLPGTTAAIRTSLTGVPAIDRQLQILLMFFYPTIDGSRPAASIQLAHFGGQVVAAWGLLMLEASRTGNKGRIISLCVSTSFKHSSSGTTR